MVTFEYMKKPFTLITLMFFAANTTIMAQITTSTMTTVQYVQNVLLGGGVTASNITFTGLAKQIASYTSTPGGNLGINKGVYLTSGANGLGGSGIGPNGPSTIDQDNQASGSSDPDLNTIGGVNTKDAVVLEFDFIPQSDTVKFRYVFGSEEYNEFVNSFNDVFAFILSGVTTPLSPTNIALIPGTSTPITINNVNNGNSGGVSTGPCTNCAYYRDNINGGINCVYDGLTTVLTAKHPVICGEKYHIKIAIADAVDQALDSGVFLEAGSFSSIPPVTVYSANSNASFTDSVMVEDCNTNCVYFVRNGSLAQKDSFNLQVTGNAVLGADYSMQGNPGFAWPTKLIFNVNQDTIKFCNLFSSQDNIAEQPDTILFTLTTFTVPGPQTCALSNTIKFRLYVQDYTPMVIHQGDTIICNGLSSVLDAQLTGGLPIYNYSWAPLSSSSPSITTGPVTTVTNYTISVNDLCNKQVNKQITVTPSRLPVLSINSPTKFCLDTLKTLEASVSGGKSPFLFNWFAPLGGITPYDTVGLTYYLMQSITPSSGTYSLVVTDQCSKQDTVIFDLTTVDCTVIIPNVITANGDNVNDVFKINGLDNFPNSVLNVFNRWGKKIYSSGNYKNDWKPQNSDGTYFYTLEVSDGRSFNGFFQIYQ